MRKFSRLPLSLSLLCVAVLYGCSFSQPAAPIRDLNPPLLPVRHHPVRPSGNFVVVRPGDNLFRIAFDHGLDYRRLARWNNLTDPSSIYVGERLRLIPPPEAPPPAPTPSPTGAKPAPHVAYGYVTTDAAPKKWVWPAKGQVITEFGQNPGSKGIDIAGRLDSPVVAAAPGRIIYVGSDLRGYGKLVIIKHSKILLSAYGHNDKVLVSEGQVVKLGQPIAEMGDTGAHRVELHFEIREYGKPVDPLKYLPGSPG